jgi:hypothetical protein
MPDRPYSLNRLRRRRGAVVAVALLLLGFQLVGGNLHAAGAGHDPASECQLCLALDRLDPAIVTPEPAASTVTPDRPIAAPASPAAITTVPRPYAIRAPPTARRS